MGKFAKFNLRFRKVNANLFPVSRNPCIVHTIKRVPESLEKTDNTKNMVDVSYKIVAD